MVMTTRSYHFNIHDSPAIFIIGINKELLDFTVIKIFKLENTTTSRPLELSI
jgi:penicillin V acylase-like amidase (Ntn superfamily)